MNFDFDLNFLLIVQSNQEHSIRIHDFMTYAVWVPQITQLLPDYINIII